MTFDSQGRLTSYYDGSGFNFASTAVAEFGADGTVAWGRWSSGTISGSTNDTGASPILHYAVGETTVDPSTLASLVKTYTAFASDAPTIDNGSSLTAGLPNGTTGTLSVNCVSNTLTYSLTITVGGQQFVVSGSAPFHLHPAIFLEAQERQSPTTAARSRAPAALCRMQHSLTAGCTALLGSGPC